jgi:hypothetical protein
MDSARVLMALVTVRRGRQQAALITSAVGLVAGMGMAFWGLYIQELTLAILGLWSAMNSYELRQRALYGDWAWDPGPTVPPLERKKRPGWIARWRTRRAQRRLLKAEQDRRRFDRDVDAALAKVRKSGLASLSPEEREILEEASRRARGE